MGDDSLFDLDSANVAHLRQHRVSASEFEEAILNDPVEMEFQTASGEPRFKSLGRTGKGRLLVLVWTVRGERVRAITAYPASRALARMWPRLV